MMFLTKNVSLIKALEQEYFQLEKDKMAGLIRR